VSANECPPFRYALTASTITDANTITNFELDLIVPAAPTINGNDNAIPPWGIFPFIEPVVSKNENRYGILQPVLEWDYSHRTHQWTITPWYEDGLYSKNCGNTKEYCQCTDTQNALVGYYILNPPHPSPSTKSYSQNIKCHKKCEPKHGQRILAFEGNVIHFTIVQIDENTWETTAKNMASGTLTSFQTTCIKSGDKLKVGLALENSAEIGIRVKNENQFPKSCPGNFKFTNIKFSKKVLDKTEDVNLKLDPIVDTTAKSCFSWLDIKVENKKVSFFNWNEFTTAVEFITKDPAHRDL